MKLKTATIFRLLYQLKSLGIFYLYFLFFTIIIPSGVVTITTTVGDSATVNSDLTTPAVIFVLILSIIGIKNDFKFFIQNGVKRLNIFLVTMITNFVLGNAIVASMIMLQKILNLISHNRLNYSMLIVEQYVKNSVVLTYLLMLVIVLFAGSLGSLLGLFFSRFSSMIRIIVGGGIALLPLMLVTIFRLLNVTQKQVVIDWLASILGVTDNGLKPAPLMLTLLFLTGINIIITYLLNRRQELQRMS